MTGGATALLIALVSACTGQLRRSGPAEFDGGFVEADLGDASAPRDLGDSVDLGAPRDLGPRTDGGRDAGTPADLGAPSDLGTPSDSGPPVGTGRLREGVTLSGLALFQGTRVGLATGGAVSSTRNAPIVALRDALVRAYVTVSAPTTVTGELEVRDGGRTIAVHADTRMITRSSRDDDPASVLAFRIPAAQLTTTASIVVRLVDPTGTPETAAAHPARLPRDGSPLALGAEDDGAGLSLVLVPLRWDTDGSGRLPDVSDAWVAQVRALLGALYPLVDIRISVRAAVPWSDPLTLFGNVDFGDINAMLMDLRAADRAPNAAYYYALVAPAATYTAYCGGSCVTGQSYVVDDPADGDFRVGSGVGFGSEDSAWTLAHELGHEFGRYHAPCDTSGADRAYPYAGGDIGTWGWDVRDGSFLAPTATTDFMGYCAPTWVSDYTWSALFARTIATSALSYRTPEDSLLVRLGTPHGAVVSGRRRIVSPHTSAYVAYEWLHGARALPGGHAPVVTQSHSDERLVVLPAPPPDADAVRIDGITVDFAR
jgi:hypothetical protein